VIDAGFPAQDVKPSAEEGFRLPVFSGALIGTGQIDAERAVLFAEVGRVGLRLVNRARLLEFGNSQIVIPLLRGDAAEGIEALGDA
jgi:hypothetical protein